MDICWPSNIWINLDQAPTVFEQGAPAHLHQHWAEQMCSNNLKVCCHFCTQWACLLDGGWIGMVFGCLYVLLQTKKCSQMLQMQVLFSILAVLIQLCFTNKQTNTFSQCFTCIWYNILLTSQHSYQINKVDIHNPQTSHDHQKRNFFLDFTF